LIYQNSRLKLLPFHYPITDQFFIKIDPYQIIKEKNK